MKFILLLALTVIPLISQAKTMSSEQKQKIVLEMLQKSAQFKNSELIPETFQLILPRET